MRCRFHIVEQWLVRVMCAIALVSVGFAHELPAIGGLSAGPASYAQYTLPDGTLPTLCVTVTDDDGQGRHQHDKAHNHGCEACRIGASVMLPAPADAAGAQVGYAVAQSLPLRVEAFHRHIFPPNTGPRAPPADQIRT